MNDQTKASAWTKSLKFEEHFIQLFSSAFGWMIMEIFIYDARKAFGDSTFPASCVLLSIKNKSF